MRALLQKGNGALTGREAPLKPSGGVTGPEQLVKKGASRSVKEERL